MSTLTTLNPNDTGSVSRGVINANFTALNTDKAELASPAFTGNPTAPTQASSDNSTKLATTAYVQTAVAGTRARVRAYKSAGNQQIDTAFEKVTFESESYDSGSNFNTGTSVFTAPRTGYYTITANGDGDSNASNAGRATTIAIYKNGVIYSSCSSHRTDAAGVANGVTITDTLYLTASDTIEIYALASAESADFFSGERYTFVTIIEL